MSWLFSFLVLVTGALHLVQKEKSCDYPNSEKEAFLAAFIAAHPIHYFALAPILQLPATRVHRHSFLLLVPTPMGDHYSHYHGCSLLC